MSRGSYYIAIEGVIGSGKTSLAHLLAERMNGELILEEPEENLTWYDIDNYVSDIMVRNWDNWKE